MSIGSAPEIGTKFSTWGKMSEETQRKWFDHMREVWGPNLYNGYGTLCRPDQQRMERINKEWEDVSN